jgi:hypothetical protein
MDTSQLFTESYAGEEKSWRYIAIIAGLVACFVYPIVSYVPISSRQLQVFLGASFGPALAIASIGLGHILRQASKAISIELAMISNILAGALVTAMIIVQLAVNYSAVPPAGAELTRFVTQRIWDVILGLDVSFDVFIGIGTTLFGFTMLRDPRFGKIIGWTGIVIGMVILLGFNFYTFPVPPRDAGLFDPGPITGLWYLAVVLLVIRVPRLSRSKIK